MTAENALRTHLEVAASRHRGVLKRLRSESGIFVAVLIGLSLFGSMADALLQAPMMVFMAAALPSLALIALGLWLDRHEPEPSWLLLRCLLWGATISILFAGFAQEAVGDIFTDEARGTVLAPIVEEAIKACAILWLIRHYRTHFNGRLDAVIYALFVGLGFTIVEDFEYYRQAFAVDAQEFWLTVLVRLPTTALHPLFTSVFAAAVVLGERRGGVYRIGLPLLGYALAVVLHGLWNSNLEITTRIAIFVPLTVAFFWLAMAVSERQQKQVLMSLESMGELNASQAAVLRRLVESAKPGLLEWALASRDPSHPYHRDWRIRQLAWIASSPASATMLARASSPGIDGEQLQFEARRWLREELSR